MKPPPPIVNALWAFRGDSFIAPLTIAFDGPLKVNSYTNAAHTAFHNFPGSRNRLNWLSNAFSNGTIVTIQSQRGRAVFPGDGIINYFKSVGDLRDLWDRKIKDFTVFIDVV